MVRIYRISARIFPLVLRKKIKNLLSYSNIKVDFENFIGFLNLSSILLGLIAGFFLGFLLQKSFWIFFITFTLLTNIVAYLWILLLIDKKARLIEESLPDALQLMASNLKSGMTPDRAFILSSRPEFGPLKEEIDVVSRKVALGKNVGEALLEMAKMVRSRRLIRAIELINSGLSSGGNLGDLLGATAQGLREQFLIDKKIKSGITMYIIFIFSATSIITPILFGLSSFLVEVLSQTLSQVDIPSSAVSSLPITISGISISSEFLITFILTFILVNSFMASMLLGLIGKGSQREGLRYFLPMIFLAIPIFLLSRYLIKSILGGLFGF